MDPIERIIAAFTGKDSVSSDEFSQALEAHFTKLVYWEKSGYTQTGTLVCGIGSMVTVRNHATGNSYQIETGNLKFEWDGPTLFELGTWIGVNQKILKPTTLKEHRLAKEHFQYALKVIAGLEQTKKHNLSESELAKLAIENPNKFTSIVCPKSR